MPHAAPCGQERTQPHVLQFKEEWNTSTDGPQLRRCQSGEALPGVDDAVLSRNQVDRRCPALKACKGGSSPLVFSQLLTASRSVAPWNSKARVRPTDKWRKRPFLWVRRCITPGSRDPWVCSRATPSKPTRECWVSS